MDNKISFIQSFITESYKEEFITGSASKRKYSRLKFESKSLILCESEDIKETEDFLFLTNQMSSKDFNVPEVIGVSNNKRFYLLEDLGSTSLLQLRIKGENCTGYYQKIISELVRLQTGLNSNNIFESISGYKSFNETLIYRDLFYFKHYFLDLLETSYHEVLLLKEFKNIKDIVSTITHQGFMYRDLQGRNIMIYNDEPYFIDYQGGMKGPVVYDLISLTWQAKANLSSNEKHGFKEFYLTEWNKLGHQEYNQIQFNKDYNICLLLRLLQVLGAYGRLGILQKKEHFKTSIQFGINNLKEVTNQVDFQFPEIKKIAESIKFSI